MSYTYIKITVSPTTDVNTLGRLLRTITNSEAVEEFSVDVD